MGGMRGSAGVAKGGAEMGRPSLRERLGEAWKAFSVSYDSSMGLGSWLYGTLPGSRVDYEREAGPPWLNSAVSICLSWIADNFPEPDLQVVRRRPDGIAEPAAGHPLLDLLERPNPYHDGDALWTATLLSYVVDGNAYWIKSRSAGGTVRSLWYAPHWLVRPAWPADGSEFISHYVYSVGGREVRYGREDVVHFRYGLDPENPRLGLSRVKPVLREVFTDNEAATYTAALLKNAGVPSVILSPADAQVTVKEPQRQAIKELWKEGTTGDRRGEPLVPSVAVKVDQLSWSPEQLRLEKIRQVPEARICGALRISPMAVDLDVGLERSTYSNKQDARRAAYHDCLIPLQKRMARCLTHSLLPDLRLDPTEQVAWDYSRVAALGEDRAQLFARLSQGYRSGWLKRSDARSAAGLPVSPEDDVYAGGA